MVPLSRTRIRENLEAPCQPFNDLSNPKRSVVSLSGTSSRAPRTLYLQLLWDSRHGYKTFGELSVHYSRGMTHELIQCQATSHGDLAPLTEIRIPI